MAEINLFLIFLGSIGFDFLIGDPRFLIHPVQIIGFYIKKISDLHNSFKLEWNTFVNSFDQIEFALDEAKEKLEDYRGTRKRQLQNIIDKMASIENLKETEEK